MRIPWLTRQRQAVDRTQIAWSGEDRSGQRAPADPYRVAAVRYAASLWSSSLASADVDGVDGLRAAAITPNYLESVGRRVVLAGEAVDLLDATSGFLQLIPCRIQEILPSQNYAPSSWRYRVDVAVPGGQRTITAAADQLVIHVWEPGAVGRGSGPFAESDTALLAARVEGSLALEAKLRPGYLAAWPGGRDPHDGSEAAAQDGLDDLLHSFSDGSDPIAYVETESFDSQGRSGPGSPYGLTRIGASPPGSLVELRRAAALDALLAAGIPPQFVSADGSDAADSALRQFVRLSLQPRARTITATLAAALGAPDLQLNFESLRIRDFQGAARGTARLVDAGAHLHDALRLAGLDPTGVRLVTENGSNDGPE